MDTNVGQFSNEGDGREDMITGGENAQVLSSVALRGCSCY